MKHTFLQHRKYISPLTRGVCSLAVSGVLLAATLAHAQVEALDPNPLEPAGVGTHNGIESRGRGSAGAPIGRAAGRAGRAEENPAETLLRDIEGTNYGRRTGHALPRASRGEMYFARRGDYENAIYAPRAGSYRYPAPRRGSIKRPLQLR